MCHCEWHASENKLTHHNIDLTFSCLLFKIIPVLVIWKAVVLVISLKGKNSVDFLVVQWLRLRFHCRGAGLIPAQGTKTPHASECQKKKQKTKKQKPCVTFCAITIYLRGISLNLFSFDYLRKHFLSVLLLM